MSQGKRHLETITDLERAIGARDLSGTLVRRMDLSMWPMDGLRIDGAEWVEVGLQGASLRGALCRGSEIVGARMRGARWAQARLEDCLFRGCDASEVSFRKADLLGVRFEETPLANGDFEGATLVAPYFDASDLYGARFAGSVLVKGRFVNRRLGNAVLTRVDFSRAVLVETDLRGADLAGASLRNALLIRTRLQDANLEGADLEGLRMVDCPPVSPGLDPQLVRTLEASSVARKEGEGEVLAFLGSNQEVLLPLTHGLLLAYVLGREPPGEPAPASESPPRSPEPPSSPTQPLPEPTREAPRAGTVGGRTDRPRMPAAEPRETYERIKKIELD